LATRDSSILMRRPSTRADEAESIAHRLRKGVGVKNVVLTRGEQGMSVASPNSVSCSFPALAKQVQDEAGAGDVVGAVLALALSAGANCLTAAWLGNVAASVKVSKFGTTTVSDHEILEALGDKIQTSEKKVVNARQAAELAERWRGDGKKVVFTNGCFDILHLGHVTYLEKARALGDALIVGINTDASVRRLKGPERPVNNEHDRARIIAAQACVDAVVLFGEDTPLELIKSVKPHVLCKGADYQSKQDVVGWDVVEANGGRVELIDLVEGRSTSRVIEKMRSGEESDSVRKIETLAVERKGEGGSKRSRRDSSIRKRSEQK
ncbi:MAG TPA: D-glycero-beta-D-manno-heptose 1-phosphate adenylyltransferase, partial [Planctomycetota bacterium]|nr:D-glycero-beta-D-manno-heptose 1-phosphate adenylyltransferase [Planctomycetota bacterium]